MAGEDEDQVEEQAPTEESDSSSSGGGYSSDTSDQDAEDARRRQQEAEQEAQQSEQAAQPQQTRSVQPQGESYNPKDTETDQDYPQPATAEPTPTAPAQPAAQPAAAADSSFPDPWAAPTGGPQDLEDSAPVAKSQMEQLFKDIMAYTRERFNLHHAGNEADNSKGPDYGYDPGATPSEMRMGSATHGLSDQEKQAGTEALKSVGNAFSRDDTIEPGQGYDPGMTPTERAARATQSPGGESPTPPAEASGLSQVPGKVAEFFRPGLARGPDDKGGGLAQASKAATALVPRVAQYLMGHGAMEPQEAAAHEQRLAPNAVSTGEKKAETLAGLAAEDKNKASDYVLMNKGQHQSIQAGAFAALEHGDIGSAARMATEAHHHLFDGNDLLFKPSADGKGVSGIVVGENGDTKRYDLTQDGFGHFLRDAQSGHYDQLADRGIHDVLREASQVGAKKAAEVQPGQYAPNEHELAMAEDRASGAYAARNYPDPDEQQGRGGGGARASRGQGSGGYPAGPNRLPSSAETVGDENQPYHYRDSVINRRLPGQPGGLDEAHRAEYNYGPEVKVINGVPVDNKGRIISPTPAETVLQWPNYNKQAYRERQAMRAAGWGGGGAERAIVPPGEHLPLEKGDPNAYPRAGAIPEFDRTTGNPDIMAGKGVSQSQGTQGDRFDQQARRDMPWASQAKQQGAYAQSLRQQDQKNQIDMTKAQGAATRGQSAVEAARIRAGASVYGTDQRRDAATGRAQSSAEAVQQRREAVQAQNGWRDRSTQQRINEMQQRHQDAALNRQTKIIADKINRGETLNPQETEAANQIMQRANKEATNPGSTGVQPRGRAPAAAAPAAPSPGGAWYGTPERHSRDGVHWVDQNNQPVQ